METVKQNTLKLLKTKGFQFVQYQNIKAILELRKISGKKVELIENSNLWNVREGYPKTKDSEDNYTFKMEDELEDEDKKKSIDLFKNIKKPNTTFIFPVYVNKHFNTILLDTNDKNEVSSILYFEPMSSFYNEQEKKTLCNSLKKRFKLKNIISIKAGIQHNAYECWAFPTYLTVELTKEENKYKTTNEIINQFIENNKNRKNVQETVDYVFKEIEHMKTEEIEIEEKPKETTTEKKPHSKEFSSDEVASEKTSKTKPDTAGDTEKAKNSKNYNLILEVYKEFILNDNPNIKKIGAHQDFEKVFIDLTGKQTNGLFKIISDPNKENPQVQDGDAKIAIGLKFEGTGTDKKITNSIVIFADKNDKGAQITRGIGNTIQEIKIEKNFNLDLHVYLEKDIFLLIDKNKKIQFCNDNEDILSLAKTEKEELIDKYFDEKIKIDLKGEEINKTNLKNRVKFSCLSSGRKRPACAGGKKGTIKKTETREVDL